MRKIAAFDWLAVIFLTWQAGGICDLLVTYLLISSCWFI